MGGMPPTPVPELNLILQEFVAGIQAALGRRLRVGMFARLLRGRRFRRRQRRGFYRGGRPAVDRRTGRRAASAARAHSRIEKSLEGATGRLVFSPVDVLRSCARRGEPLWYMDRGHRTLAPGTHCNTAVVRQVVRQHGIRLAGAEPASLVDPVPTELLRGEIVSVICGWGQEILDRPEAWANRFYQGFIVLNYCRAWCDLNTGTVGSKRRGAEWAKARLDPAWTDLIDRAWETRTDAARTWNLPADPRDYEKTLELLAFIMKASKAEFRLSADALAINHGPQEG